MRSTSARRPDLEPTSGTAYGVSIHGRLPVEFRHHLHPASDDLLGPATRLEVRFDRIDRLPRGDEIWSAEPAGRRWRGRFALSKTGVALALSVEAEGSGLFRIGRRTIGIEWLDGREGAAHYFFANALPLWLETQGVPVLHASAATFGNRAVAFLGPSGVGKSTLIAELLRAGCHFVADDGVALRRSPAGEWRCAVGSPLLRIWPSALEGRLGVPSERLGRVHVTAEKRWWPQPARSEVPPGGLPLAAIYFLERRARADAPIRVDRFSPRQSMAQLIGHGIAASPAAALGLAAQRFELLARVAERVPVRRLSLPSGVDCIQETKRAISVDLAS